MFEIKKKTVIAIYSSVGKVGVLGCELSFFMRDTHSVGGKEGGKNKGKKFILCSA